MDSIKSFYRDAWSSWGEIPVFDREQMWNHFKTGYKKGLDEWHQSQPTSENDSSNQLPDDDDSSILSKKIDGVKKGKARGLGSEHCVGYIVYGLSAASLSSPLKQNEEEIDSLRIQVHELLKKKKADRLRLAGLENLVHHLIDNF
ncbi:uncharacterized protein LOC125859788 [Solanum stenotomum]|uniref:uncharacterized protein LOC125859788 n=1 Tax=Solanum stenotomum TaxID=172797 RepID=UPI0020D1DDCA|nr:uncharacterized protein LOC125859788 [Solanum stenotomum]